jgi:hypothetical protein
MSSPFGVALLRLGAVTLAILSAVLFVTPALGASACATAVLRDWSEDGHVAPKYSLPCYEEAIDSLPSDLRDYTDAEDVINRALSSAVRTSNPAHPVGDQNGTQGVPVALVGLVGVALVIIGAGTLGYVARRRRAVDGADVD